MKLPGNVNPFQARLDVETEAPGLRGGRERATSGADFPGFLGGSGATNGLQY